MKHKEYDLIELTKIVDNLKRRVRDLELKNEKEWASDVAKRSRKIW